MKSLVQRWRRVGGLLAFTLVATSCGGSTTENPREARATDAVLSNDWVSYSISEYVCGEWVYIELKRHESYAWLQTPSSRVAWHDHVNIVGTGTGERGSAYLMRAAGNINGTGNDWTSIQPLEFIGIGGTPNLIGHYQYHITVNANGELTSNIENVRADCH